MNLDLYTLAQRLVGEVHEVPGAAADPFILWCHQSTTLKATSDEIAWCSSFVNRLAQLCGVPRTKSAAARSWLTIGTPISIGQAQPGDVVIFKRGSGNQPGPEVIAAPGHVALFSSFDDNTNTVHVIGGNQSNGVTLAGFPFSQVLGIRRLV